MPLVPVNLTALLMLCEDPRTPVLKEIDRVLAADYGFTAEELDFILSTKVGAGIPSARLRAGNYDIKYRMGRDAESEEKWTARMYQNCTTFAVIANLPSIMQRQHSVAEGYWNSV